MKKISVEERKTRLLKACYERILADNKLVEDLELLDALKDVLDNQSAREWEWYIYKNGRIAFQ